MNKGIIYKDMGRVRENNPSWGQPWGGGREGEEMTTSRPEGARNQGNTGLILILLLPLRLCCYLPLAESNMQAEVRKFMDAVQTNEQARIRAGGEDWVWGRVWGSGANRKCPE